MPTDLEELIILNMTEGLGAVRLRALIQHFETTEHILNASSGELERVPNKENFPRRKRIISSLSLK